MASVAPYIGSITGLLALADRSFLLMRTAREAQSFPKDLTELIFRVGNEGDKFNTWCLLVLSHKLSDGDVIDDIDSRPSDDDLETRIFREETLQRHIDRARIALLEAQGIIMQYMPKEYPSIESFRAVKVDPAAVTIPSPCGYRDHVNYIHKLRCRQDAKLVEILNSSIRRHDKFLAVAKPWGQPNLDALKQAFDSLKYWNTELSQMLRPKESRTLQGEVSARFMGACNDQVDVLEIFRAAEEDEDDEDTRKSIELALRQHDLNSQTESSTTVGVVSIPFYRLRSSEGKWTLSHEDNSPATEVLLEWLDLSGLTHQQLQIAWSRLAALVDLLRMDTPTPLPTLKPLGYAHDYSTSRSCVVYERNSAPQRELISLRDLLDMKGANSHLDLGERFALARRLCRAFLELAKVKWVHRGFHSGCVLLSSTSEIPEVQDDSSPAQNREFAAIKGFQYGRPAGNDQISLKVIGNDFDGLNLYHHPEVRRNKISEDKSAAGQYLKYQIRHDMFSLGVVLLEIGLWKTAAYMHSKHPSKDVSADDFRSMLKRLALDKLPNIMGRRYSWVVCRCLDGPLSNTQLGRKDDVGWILSEIVQAMDGCHCNGL